MRGDHACKAIYACPHLSTFHLLLSRAARRLLGHSDISTTLRYMHLDERELAEAQDLVD